MELTESQHINLKKESKVEMKGGMAYSSTFGGALYPNGSRVPWLPSQTDILAEDWNVVTELV